MGNLQLTDQFVPGTRPKVNVLVRDAVWADALDLFSMGNEFHDESGLGGMAPFDLDSFGSTISSLMSGHILLVAESNDAVVGMAGGVIFPLYFNSTFRACQEIFWFTRPEFRNGVGAALLDELENEALRRGAHVFLTAALPGLRDRAIGRVYEKRGYRPAENTFVKRLSS